MRLPTGWFIEWGGQFENLQAASGRLALRVPLALLSIFTLLGTNRPQANYGIQYASSAIHSMTLSP